MECELIEYFCMGWGNTHFHYVISVCAAATLPREKDAAHFQASKECTGVGTDGATHIYKLSQWEQLRMRKPYSNTAARALTHSTFAFWNRTVVGGMPIEMYGESWFMHFQLDIMFQLYMVDT